MTKVERVLLVFLILAMGLVFIFWKDISGNRGAARVASVKEEQKKDEKNDEKKTKDDKEESEANDAAIKINERWSMPEILKEISGIAFISDKQLACVQDELGKIFIFDIDERKVVKEISFAKAGDYEGIAIVKNTAYIVRADGLLFEVNNYDGKPAVKEYDTPLTVKQNVEGLCYDEQKNRLLLAIKDKEPTADDYKGIYAFDLSSKQLNAKPVLKIDLNNDIWSSVDKKNKMQPSDLQVNPVNGDIYIVDGANPKLLVMSKDGTHKKLYQLNRDDFPQPEGIDILATGEVFICNEGKKGNGTILKLSVEL